MFVLKHTKNDLKDIPLGLNYFKKACSPSPQGGGGESTPVMPNQQAGKPCLWPLFIFYGSEEAHNSWRFITCVI